MRTPLARRTTRATCITCATLAAAALCVACTAHSGEGSARPSQRLDRTVITRDQMLKGHYTSAYDAVAALRSLWLRPRGPDSFVLPSIVWVYVDGVRVGGVEALQSIQPQLVNTLRFYDGPTATSRWGVDNAAGVIHVSTWKDGAPGIDLADTVRRTPKPDGG